MVGGEYGWYDKHVNGFDIPDLKDHHHHNQGVDKDPVFGHKCIRLIVINDIRLISSASFMFLLRILGKEKNEFYDSPSKQKGTKITDLREFLFICFLSKYVTANVYLREAIYRRRRHKVNPELIHSRYIIPMRL